MIYSYYYTSTLDLILYVLLLVIAVASLIIQAKVSSTFDKYNKVLNSRGITGAQAAERILRNHGVTGCAVQVGEGKLSDHFDPKANTIRLSKDVYFGQSVAAVGVASHEAGHAVQHAVGYAPYRLRHSIVPAVNFASKLAFPIAILGFLFAWHYVIYAGIILYAVTTLFQLVTLPVELDASRRAMKAIDEYALLDDQEAKGARRVLTVAALTYIAALSASVLQLLRLIMMASRRRR